jgi:TonB family protein
MNRLSLLILILCAVSVPQIATASDHDLEVALNSQFKDKILILRHPTGDDSLRYDAQGASLRRGHEGDWTVYGAVRVGRIELGQNELRMQGTRLCVRNAAGGLAPFEFTRPEKPQLAPPVNPSLKVEIKTDQPLTTVDQAQTLLGNVFALNKGDLLDSVPEFWRAYLAAHLDDYDFKQGKEMDFKAGASDTRRSPLSLNRSTGQPPASQETRAPMGTIYRVGPEIRAPKATFSPEPDYSDAARYERFQGVLVVDLVVDRYGKVHNVRMVRPLGLGLDEKAATKIKTWTFEPAMRDGEPVAVEMNVEVSFHLY